jgi:type II secretory pathway pseudopilin PulG
MGRRSGLSLLEVLLSVAILGGAMVIVGQLMSLGYRSAIEARLRTDAAIHCDTKMAEVASGVLPLSDVSGDPISEDPNWVFSVNIQPGEQNGLLVVTVTVSQTNTTSNNPVSMSIVRLMPDPDYDPAEDE